ncbi:SufE family protein [Agrobacterium sp. SORGH_AS 787]|uniref:SufE family protein n=1 Tax=Agrobacterium sp. SORGH_AS 787 TaxID=3041775 RepID=UPI00277E2BB6|nr:cysteine desulfuration protein SufE [Rhizobium sp. SORGH_AS_0787]
MTSPHPRGNTSILERQERLIDEFELFDDWAERYQYLIDLGRNLPPLSPSLRTARNRIAGCQGETFLSAARQNGRLFLYGASDMPVLAGILAILVRIYADETPSDILRHPPVFLDRIGLTRRLSPHRRLALVRIHERLLALASDLEARGKLAS